MSTEEKKGSTAVSKKEPTQSQRFEMMVMKEFANNAGQLQISDFQRKLIQNYFIKLDATLKENEVKRLAKSEQYRDNLAFTWPNVNTQKLSVDVVAYASIGLDPLQPNHINLICYKNKATNKFDIGFIDGYNGLEIKGKKYGLDAPDDVVIELVYSTDKFKQIKKDANNKVETYTFEITDEFERGELKGGFYYHIFKDDPTKNKLVVMNKKDIEKRKPQYASAEFWGGEKAVYTNGKKTGVEETDGWYLEMAWKTIKRACWNDVTIDSEKIDENYHRMMQNDIDRKSMEVNQEIAENANQQTIDIEHEPIEEPTNVEPVVETKPVEEKKPEPKEKVAEPETVQKPLF